MIIKLLTILVILQEYIITNSVQISIRLENSVDDL